LRSVGPSERPGERLIRQQATIAATFGPGSVFSGQSEITINMKTNQLQVSAALAAIVVAALLPISVAAASIAACMTGVLAIICADYGRNLEPLRPDSKVSAFYLPESKYAELGKAA
jgi:hypothetical protein